VYFDNVCHSLWGCILKIKIAIMTHDRQMSKFFA
jgi:hypothetical protein